MKKTMLTVATALVMGAGAAQAADLRMPVKAPPPVLVSPWDIAFGAAVTSDYIFRGITQSNHNPGVSAYIEPRYNINPNLQLYAGLGGASISFTNRAAAEIDIYGGIRPTFGPLAFDFGVWAYLYPGGECIDALPGSGLVCPIGSNVVLPSFNGAKEDVSFFEVYGKVTWTINDMFAVGANAFYSPDFLNSGADGAYISATAKFTGPALGNIGWYVSGEIGQQFLGTSDSFFSLAGFGPGTPFSLTGIDFPDYATWNIGVGFTYKIFTLDLRYSDTNLSKSDCNGLTGDFGANTLASPVFPAAGFNPVNPTGWGSNWCDARFVAKLSVDATLNMLK